MNIRIGDRVQHVSLIWLVAALFIPIGAGALLLLGPDFRPSLGIMAVIFYTALFIIIRSKPFSLIAGALSVFPVIGMGLGYPLIYLFILMIPFSVVTFKRQIIAGLKVIFEKRDPVSIGITLMIIGAGVAVIRYLISVGINNLAIIPIGSLFLVSILFIIIIAIIHQAGYYAIVRRILSILLLVFSFTIFIYTLRSGFGFLFKIKHINILSSDVNANLPAMLLTPVLLLYMTEFFRKKGTLKTIFWNTGFIVSIIAIVSTNSRGAWAGLLCAALYLLFRIKKGSRDLMRMVSWGGAIALVLIIFLGDVLIIRFQQTNMHDHSLLARLILWSYAIPYALTHPFIGLGPDVFRTEKFSLGYPIIYDPYRSFSSHNLFIELAVNYSILCLIGFLLFVTYALWFIDRRASFEADADHKHFLLTVNAALLSILVHGLFDCGIANIGIASVMALVMGLAAVVIRRPREMTRTFSTA